MKRRKRPGCTYVEQQYYEVEWYRKHGKYPERIKVDSLGHEYVQIDLWWNQRNRYRMETIKDQLADYVAERVTGISRK